MEMNNKFAWKQTFSFSSGVMFYRTWSTDGVDTVMLDNGDVMCIAKHLTSFAILLSTTGIVSTSENEEYALQSVSYIGCGISIVCLLLAIIVLVILR